MNKYQFIANFLAGIFALGFIMSSLMTMEDPTGDAVMSNLFIGVIIFAVLNYPINKKLGKK